MDSGQVRPPEMGLSLALQLRRVGCSIWKKIGRFLSGFDSGTVYCVTMVNDAELLRHYTERGSEDAFAELVRRHVRLVYTGALRRTGGDCHLAADVSQTVFINLARNAHSLRSHPALAGWLFTATRNAAINARIVEQRRGQRELEALTMHDINTEPNQTTDPDQLRPVLYEFLDSLPEQDRAAVLLRFFAGRTFADIGQQLHLTEEATRKRVDRALERLYSAFSRRGITSTAAVVTAAMTAEAAVIVPAELAGAISSAVAAGTGTGAAISVVTAFTSMSKIKLAVVGGVLVAGVGALGLKFQDARILQNQVRSLSREAGQLATLRKQNETLNQQLAGMMDVAADAERTRLRDQIAVLKGRLAAAAMQPAAGFDERKMRPVSEMKHVGFGSPEAAFETISWSQIQDRETMLRTFAQSFRFDAATKRKADAFFANLSEDAQAKFQTPEQLFTPYVFGWANQSEAAFESHRDVSTEVQILDKSNHDFDPDQVDLRFWQRSGSNREAGGFQGSVKLTRVGNEWFQVLRISTEENWQKLVAQIDPRTGEPQPQGK